MAAIVNMEERRAERQRRVKRPAPGVWRRARFNGITPERVAAVERRAEQGQVEDLADLYAYAMRDPRVREAVETRLLAVAGAELQIDPPLTGGEGFNDGVAQAIHDAFRLSFDFAGSLTHLLHAENVGWASMEHRWVRRSGMWISSPAPIESRDVRFVDRWRVQFRTYEDGRIGTWSVLADEHPNRFICHVPQKFDRPTVSGDLLSVLWTWVYSRWAEIYRQQAMEKHGAPFVLGKVPEGAPDRVINEMYEELESFSHRRYAVVSEQSAIEFVEPTQKVGETFKEAIKDYSTDIATVLLGADLTFEAAGTAGGRALGESLFATKVLPRLHAQAKRLAATLERDWVRPFLATNAHLFGNAIPPTPQLRFRLVNELPDGITPQDIHAGLHVTRNEYRAAKRLPPVLHADGGEEPVTPQPTTSAAVAEGETAAQPRGRQMPLPL